MQKIIGLVVAGIILITGAYFIFDGIKDIKTAPTVVESTAVDIMNKIDDAKMVKEGAEGVMEKIDGAMEKVDEVVDDAMEKVEDGMEKMEDSMEKDTTDSMEKEDVMTNNMSQEITLRSVDSRGGDAQAARIIKDGVFTHFATVNNIDPAEGKFFEGWLTTDSSFVSTGRMEKDEEGMWRLVYTSTKDLTMYNRVVITEETEADGLDNKPETHIFEGEF